MFSILKNSSQMVSQVAKTRLLSTKINSVEHNFVVQETYYATGAVFASTIFLVNVINIKNPTFDLRTGRLVLFSGIKGIVYGVTFPFSLVGMFCTQMDNNLKPASVYCKHLND